MSQSLNISKLCFVLALVLLSVRGQAQPRDDGPTAQWPCPIADKITPCVCTWDESYKLFLDCSAATTIEELGNVFTVQFPFENFYSLTIDQTGCTNCSLTSLPAGVLGEAITFHDITITGTQIEVIEEGVFTASHDTLVRLKLSSNAIHSFPAESLGSYNSLGYLYLNANDFTAIDPIYSLVSEILVVINLSSNDLSVRADFVSGCPMIKNVQLRNMHITEVPIFDESPIGMFTGLEYIESVDFGSNSITEIQTNTIVAVAATLKLVDFSQNNISILHPAFVSGFTAESNVTLNMSRNAISRLDQAVWEDILSEIPGENSVDLSNNPLLCGCDIAWLVSSPLKTTLTNTTTCESGTPVVELQEDVFDGC